MHDTTAATIRASHAAADAAERAAGATTQRAADRHAAVAADAATRAAERAAASQSDNADEAATRAATAAQIAERAAARWTPERAAAVRAGWAGASDSRGGQTATSTLPDLARIAG